MERNLYECPFCDFKDSLVAVKDHIRKLHKMDLEKCLDVNIWKRGQKIKYTFEDKLKFYDKQER